MNRNTVTGRRTNKTISFTNMLSLRNWLSIWQPLNRPTKQKGVKAKERSWYALGKLSQQQQL